MRVPGDYAWEMHQQKPGVTPNHWTRLFIAVTVDPRGCWKRLNVGPQNTPNGL